MLTVDSISLELGGRLVLDRASFTANAGEVIGIVGPNGSGKTTLLRIIAGDLKADAGRIITAPRLEVAYLPQGREVQPGQTVGELFPGLFAGAAEQRLNALAERLAEASDRSEIEELAGEYDGLVASLGGGVSGPASADLLRALDVDHIPADREAATLSGGEVTKLGLVQATATRPDILLLDEPTNHLDLPAIRWVERYLRGFAGVAVVVSHDRALLDAVATAIVEIDARTHRTETFPGNYTAYSGEKARREADHWERYERQQKEERHLREVISNIETRARGIEQSTIDFARRKKALKIARRGVTLRNRVERQLASAEHVERPPKAIHGLQGAFATAEGPATLVVAENVRLSVADRQLIAGLTFRVDRGDRLAITGPNGAGKTTLFRAIQGEHPISGGELRLAGGAAIGYLAQQDGGEHSYLATKLTPVQALRRTTTMSEAEANNFLHRFLLSRDQLSTPLARLSFGERRRFALAGLIARGTNLLLLDEPTNHLDLPSREAFEAALAGYEGAAIVVSHDRYFVERFADAVLDLGEYGPAR
jgi:ATP-binding cassette, subfamily F, member 3